MYSIGENVVYGASGVMSVVDIREETVGDVCRRYYVLKAPQDGNASLTFVPVDNEKLTSAMRPLISKEEVLAIIKEIDSIPEAEWIGDNRRRQESFKRIIESGDHRTIISMIKSIYSSGVRREEEGKKNYLVDDAAMHKAEHVLYSEFSLVLGIPEEDIPEFISVNK
jgi:CarD family transcriptional regulator